MVKVIVVERKEDVTCDKGDLEDGGMPDRPGE